VARRKLRVVRDLPTTPRKPRTPDRDRYLSECSRSVFKKGTWLTIGQLSRAFASAHRVRTLGLPVTAKGIETAGQADVLRSLGCESAQGWLFSRAVEPAVIDAMVDDAGPVDRPG